MSKKFSPKNIKLVPLEEVDFTDKKQKVTR